MTGNVRGNDVIKNIVFSNIKLPMSEFLEIVNSYNPHMGSQKFIAGRRYSDGTIVRPSVITELCRIKKTKEAGNEGAFYENIKRELQAGHNKLKKLKDKLEEEETAFTICKRSLILWIMYTGEENAHIDQDGGNGRWAEDIASRKIRLHDIKNAIEQYTQQQQKLTSRLASVTVSVNKVLRILSKYPLLQEQFESLFVEATDRLQINKTSSSSSQKRSDSRALDEIETVIYYLAMAFISKIHNVAAPIKDKNSGILDGLSDTSSESEYQTTDEASDTTSEFEDEIPSENTTLKPPRSIYQVWASKPRPLTETENNKVSYEQRLRVSRTTHSY